MNHHYNTNSSGKQGLFWEGNPRRPVRHHQDSWTKIKLRKIREFGSFESCVRTPVHQLHQFRPKQRGPPGSLWSFNPTNSYSHTIKRSRKPPILQVLTKLFNPYYLLFLPANSGDSILPGLPPSVNKKIMADFRHSSVRRNARAPR